MPVTDSLKLGTEATIMAVREYLMSYFKNTTDCHVKDSTNISIGSNVQVPEDRRLHSYERHAIEMQSPRLLKIGRSNLMSLQKNPHKVVLYTRTLNRSEEMRAVREGIEKCLEKYLRGVEVSTIQRGSFDGSEDKELVSNNAPDKHPPVPRMVVDLGRNEITSSSGIAFAPNLHSWMDVTFDDAWRV